MSVLNDMKTTPQQKIQPTPSVLSSRVGDELMFLNADNEIYYQLDSVGVRFWECLSETGAIEPAVDRLEKLFDVGRERLLADMCQLVEELRENGLVQLVED